MKIKTRFVTFFTIIIVVFTIFIIVINYIGNKINFNKDLSSTRKILTEYSDKTSKISKEFISTFTKEFLEIETSNILPTVSRFIKEDIENKKLISKDKRLKRILMTPITVNGQQVGYFTLAKYREMIFTPNIRKKLPPGYAKIFPELLVLEKECIEKGKAKGYYRYYNMDGSKIVKKYAVIYRIFDTPYKLFGCINIEEYQDAGNASSSELKETYLNIIKDELTENSKSYFTGSSLFFLISIVIIASIFIILLFLLMNPLIKPLIKLTKKVNNYIPGKTTLKITLPKGSSEEIIDLANSFRSLNMNLIKYMKNYKQEVNARQIIENEIHVARTIQLSVLPKLSDEFKRKEFTLYAKLIPAKEVAGDFYDFFYLNENKLALVIGDVSGKGIASAFFMQRAITLIHSYSLIYQNNPEKVLDIVNKILTKNNDACMFVTVFLAYYDINTGELLYANAGHHEANLMEKNNINSFGSFNRLALACCHNSKYIPDSILMEKGETLVLYTDGVIEANSPEKEFYGTERIIENLYSNRKESVKTIGDEIIQKVKEFEKAKQFDDITVLLLRRN
jgi:hypothetical protein